MVKTMEFTRKNIGPFRQFANYQKVNSIARPRNDSFGRADLRGIVMVTSGFKSIAKALAIGSAVALTATPVVLIADASNPMYTPKKKKSQVKARSNVKARQNVKPKSQAKAKSNVRPRAQAPKAPVNDFVPSYSPPNPPMVQAPVPAYTPPVPVASAPVLAAPVAAAPSAAIGAPNYLLGALALAGLVGGGLLIADAVSEDEPVSP